MVWPPPRCGPGRYQILFFIQLMNQLFFSVLEDIGQPQLFDVVLTLGPLHCAQELVDLMVLFLRI